jgi:tRNA(fMet)-specific endonuclease VapC
MTGYMLDTDVSSYIIRRRPAALPEKLKPIGNMDLLIASHAVAQGMALVTNNLRHFSSVPGLKVEVWG